MNLTAIGIKNARPKATAYKLYDGEGLLLLVRPNGGKQWRLKYRIDDKERSLSLGSYPQVTLVEARDLARKARAKLARGVDPVVAKKENAIKEAVARATTFGAIASEFVQKQIDEQKAARTIQKVDWILTELASSLAKRPIASITAPEVLQVLRKLEKRGINETAHRARSTISRVFRYAMATGRAEIDPTIALNGALVAHKTRHRPAIINPKEVGELLRAIDGLERMPIVKSALQLLIICFPRPGELRLARWIEFDLKGAVWQIPAERMKMRRPHAVPLPPQAIRILRNLEAITGDGELLFPGIRSRNRPISDVTMNAALRRMGYAADEVTGHGFRTTASTLLNESGYWHPDAIERALAHQDPNSVRRAYSRGAYWDERVRMAAWWADYLDALRDNRPAPVPQKSEWAAQADFKAKASFESNSPILTMGAPLVPSGMSFVVSDAPRRSAGGNLLQ